MSSSLLMASMTVAPVLTNTRRVGELNKSLENSYLLPLKRQKTAPKGGVFFSLISAGVF